MPDSFYQGMKKEKNKSKAIESAKQKLEDIIVVVNIVRTIGIRKVLESFWASKWSIVEQKQAIERWKWNVQEGFRKLQRCYWEVDAKEAEL